MSLEEFEILFTYCHFLLVSSSESIRAEVRRTLRKYLRKNVSLVELDYQPLQ
jgi:hypothetical protein